MNKSKVFFLSGLLGLFSIPAFSQSPYATNASDFSRTTFGGSARYQGLGGATTALGADIGTLYSNPAGLGLYRRSDVSITPGFNFARTDSDYLNKSTRDNKQSMNVGSIGIVFSGAKDDIVPGKFRGGSFGISMTRTNNFQNQFTYGGLNKNNSFADFAAEYTNDGKITEAQLYNDQVAPDGIYDLSGLAYYSFLIDPVSGTTWKSVLRGSPVQQKGSISMKGNQNQWDFAYGANIDDKIYLGASIGIASVKYLVSESFMETPAFGNDTILDYTFYQDVSVKGTGLNLKIGAIFRPKEWIRIGLTAQTPTHYWLREEVNQKMKVNLTNSYADAQGVDDPFQSFSIVPIYNNYTLNTPAKLKGGIALFAGKAGFISADFEAISYDAAKLGSNPDNIDLSGDNETIKNIYQTAYNINIGAEARIKDFRIRGGYARLGDPYRKGVVDNLDRTINNICIGAGIKSNDFYLDLAIVNTFYKSRYYPYHLHNGKEPVATINNKNTSVVFTIGTNF